MYTKVNINEWKATDLEDFIAISQKSKVGYE